uniref:glycosyltransferase family 4 protein n=1 Tax=Algoriphagus sp. TaxID=1872435 RepID=UPI004047D63A
MKTIWIINRYANTPDIGYAGRSYYLSGELANLGYRVFLIAGANSHMHFKPLKNNISVEVKEETNFNLVWIKLLNYSSAQSKVRILNWFLFSWKLMSLNNYFDEKPDIIIYSTPPLIDFLGAKYLSNFFKAKLITDVRDLWPSTFVEVGGYSSSNLLIKFMKWVEIKTCRESDYMISNLPLSYVNFYSNGLKEGRFKWIPNGFSNKEILNKIEISYEIRNVIPKNKFIVGYCGSLGLANAMEYLIEASLLLKNHKDIFFLIVGNGDKKKELINKVEFSHNIIFIDSIPKTMVFSVLDCFDVCYLGWRNRNIYEFGVGANKISEYLYSGKPILHSYSGEYDYVKIANAGISVQSENILAIKNGILKFYLMNIQERKKLGDNGKKYAAQYFNYSNIALEIQNVFHEL